jgi:hypothetical protein
MSTHPSDIYQIVTNQLGTNKIRALISVTLSYLSSTSVLYSYYCASLFLYD